MRILLDECVNPKLALAFPVDEVRTVADYFSKSASGVWRGVASLVEAAPPTPQAKPWAAAAMA